MNWRDIPGYGGDYAVSDCGKVWTRKKDGKFLAPVTTPDGHKRVKLSRDGHCTAFMVHRLVLAAFRPGESGEHVRHLNGIPSDNRLVNLKYGTAKENYDDQVRHGVAVFGERNGSTKLRECDVLEIRSRTGQSTASLAREYGLSVNAIHKVRKRLSWRHLP